MLESARRVWQHWFGLKIEHKNAKGGDTKLQLCELLSAHQIYIADSPDNGASRLEFLPTGVYCVVDQEVVPEDG